jgi:hypothetical protein
MDQRLTAILPCNGLDAAQAFFERLGFKLEEGSPDDYRMLSDERGGFVHLNRAVEGWLKPGAILSGFTFTARTSTPWRQLLRARPLGRLVTPRGACMNLHSMALTKRWCGWVGPPVCAIKIRPEAMAQERHGRDGMTTTPDVQRSFFTSPSGETGSGPD